MRSLFLLVAVCCLVLSAWASPISRAEEDNKEVAVARQSAAPAPAASSDDDDDEEDDDDDDDVDDLAPDLGGDDDDDDDDEEEDEEEADDDEDDDYLERFIDDILGGTDDDDDEEEETAVAAQPVVAAAETVAAAPAVAAASTEEVANTAGEEAEAVDGEVDAEPEAGQKEPAEAEVAEVAAAAEDDEEEDDITDALDPEADDDDEEEDEEEDDEEEDDDDITDALGRKISAKHSRALSEPAKKQASVPAIYIVKYNKFVDTILDKMNDVLRQSYDPVSVKLQPIDASKKGSKPKKNKNKSKRKSSNKKKNTARGEIKQTSTEIPEKTKEENPEVNEITPESAGELIQNAIQSRALDAAASSKAKPTTIKTKPPTKTPKQPTKTPKPPTKQTKPKPQPTKSTTKKPTTTKNKTKTSEKSKPRAKGTLYGLSSLKRTGDVTVNIMSNHTTVKSNFAVGPLILRVEKVVGRGAKKEVKSATATTAEMAGKLSLRINNQGVATLHSIKVLQPKQVRVDSNHERTRELVWRRSARIAHVVSEKLLSASKPMFYHQAVVKQ